MKFENNVDFAKDLDAHDSLSAYRNEFYYPGEHGDNTIYLCGNSLGLQPKIARDYIAEELDKWAKWGVEGHVKGDKPWVYYNKLSKKALAELVGGLEDEVVSMNNLTTNLHLLLATFYQPVGMRTKILIEKSAFPSDYFAVESFIRMKGLDPREHLQVIEIPRNGYLDNDMICDAIGELGNELSLVLFPGVQYYTGQFFDMARITSRAHEVGAYAGFDLAHAIGNVPMQLHQDRVDFATWCSYKYLNSGPGNVSGVFIHREHVQNKELPRLTGWWGHEEETRFKMKNKFIPPPTVDGWQLSNVNILGTAAHLAALSLFEKAGLIKLREKSIQLTSYLEFLIEGSSVLKAHLEIITPGNSEERGCQLSLRFRSEGGKEVFNKLLEQGIILDWREPDVIRVAPTPFYNTYVEVFHFAHALQSLLE